ncbi:MAG: hypothetical protein LBS99_00730 [Clostridiales bacterium]|jgi:uncharacterized membrane protein|nr:hypothetical protein [Clostridiales bacterium]
MDGQDKKTANGAGTGESGKSGQTPDNGGRGSYKNEATVSKYPGQTDVTLLKTLLAHFLGFVLPLIFFFGETDRKDKYLRYYSLQCLIAWLFAAGAVLTAGILSVPLMFLEPYIAYFLYSLAALFGAACEVFIVISGIFSYHNKIFRIPVIGNLAAKHTIDKD